MDTPYRDGGWTPRQVAHHVADSHINLTSVGADGDPSAIPGSRTRKEMR
ncbi:MAG: hypothetical protein ABSA54_22810 [Terriglobales bacterium]